MLNTYQSVDNTNWPICTCCGLTVRLLMDRQTMIYFLNHRAARRRAYQCNNCGQIICSACSHTGRHCKCQSNAWVALPYLEVADSATPTVVASNSNTNY